MIQEKVWVGLYAWSSWDYKLLHFQGHQLSVLINKIYAFSVYFDFTPPLSQPGEKNTYKKGRGGGGGGDKKKYW